MMLANFNPGWLVTLRLAVIGIVSLFSVIVLGISIHIIAETEKLHFYFTFSALALAVSLMTLATLPVMAILDMQRKGFITSQIIVEVALTGFLSILWIAAAGTTSNAYLDTWDICLWGYSNTFNGCREVQAVEAFAHLNWLWLLVYTFTILAFSVISQNNGHPVWRTTVRDGQFVTSRANNQVPVMVQQGAYPPPQQGFITPQPTGYAGSPYQPPGQIPGSPQVQPQGYQQA